MSDIKYNLILRAFRIFNGFEGPSSEELWWRTDGEYAPVTLMINFNDLFLWGCSDVEELTEDNIDFLEDTVEEVSSLDPRGDYVYAPILWVCRIRGMRPQGACYRFMPEYLWPLLDACGPEREVGLGNPKPRP